MATESIIVRLAMQAADYISGASKAAKATDDITGSAKKSEGALGKLGVNSVKDLAKVAAGAVAVKKGLDFAKDAIGSFSNLQESINATNVQFGEGAGIIQDFGKRSAEAVGLANSEFNQLSVTTGALLSGFITDQKDAANETINLTKRAADMASVFNTSVPDALMAVQAAIRGESEPIRRFGVLLDDASIRAKAVSLGLAESASSVDLVAKKTATLQLIYEQTNKTQGDFANTSDGLANKQRVLAAKFEDTKAKVGEALAPALDTVLDIADDLLPALENLAPALGALVSGVVSLISVVEPAIGPLASFLGVVGEGLEATAAFLGSQTALSNIRVDDAMRVQAGAIEEYRTQLERLADIDPIEDKFQFERQQEIVTATEVESVRALQQAIGTLIVNQQLYRDNLDTVTSASELSAERQAQAIRGVLDAGVELTDFQRNNLKAAFLDQLEQVDLTAQRYAELIEQYDLAAMAQERGIDPIGDARKAYIDQQNAIDENREAIRNQALANARAAREQQAAAAAARTARDAYMEQADAIRETARAQQEAASPVLALLRAQERVRDAQAKLIEVQEDDEASTQDVEAAKLDLIEAQLGLEGAAANANGKIQEGEQAFLDLAEQVGISEDEVRDFIEALDDLPTSVPIDIHTRFTTSGARVEPVQQFGGPRQHGGEAAAGELLRVGEAGPELFVPSGAGTIVPNNQLGGGPVYHIHLEGSGDSYDDVQLVMGMMGVTEEIEVGGSQLWRG